MHGDACDVVGAPPCSLFDVCVLRRFYTGCSFNRFKADVSPELRLAMKHRKTTKTNKDPYVADYELTNECKRIWTKMRYKHRLPYLRKLFSDASKSVSFHLEFHQWTPHDGGYAGVCDHCATLMKVVNRCARCKNVMFCSRQCQRDGWKEHKKTCVSVAQ